MKQFYILLFALLTTVCTTATAVGDKRSDAINVTAEGIYQLLGKKDANTVTWFCIDSSVLGGKDLVTAKIEGNNYGDISFYWNDDEDSNESYMIGGSAGIEINPTVKKYWSITGGKLYVAIYQSDESGTVDFSFTTAKPGETRFNAVDISLGKTTVETSLTKIWYKYTAQSSKQVIITSQNCTLGSAVGIDGRIVCHANLLEAGFRLTEGDEIYFPVNYANASSVITIVEEDIKPGHYADYPIDATSLESFVLDIPGDANASTDSSGQSQRYFQYTAAKSGFMMWGTDDASWIEGMYGCMVRDLTDKRTLNTPLTAINYDMLTYTIPVTEGHTYLIEQIVAHTKNARQATVYVIFIEPNKGDTKDNPIELSLNSSLDLGRTITTTKYYTYTAAEAGVYTATIHAGGQVRATTPHDGSWNITRDYSYTDLQMHIDDEITLAAGDALMLEVTLTSDIDIHANGSDSSKPNYYILITKNGATDGIMSITNDTKSSAMYNLSGMRINNASTRKGLYIKDGKKIVTTPFAVNN